MTEYHQGDLKTRNDEHQIMRALNSGSMTQHCYFASELHVQWPLSQLLDKQYFQITKFFIAPKKSMMFGKVSIFKRNTLDLFSMSASQIAEL